jgi:hypothetical protein
MMQLKLLGVLQDFGSPYASLYINGEDKTMYLAIQQASRDSHKFSSLLLRVNVQMVVDYMERTIGLRKLSQLSIEKYLWNRKKGNNGTIISLGHNDVTNRIDIVDDIFDADFCNNESSIKYYINQIGK